MQDWKFRGPEIKSHLGQYFAAGCFVNLQNLENIFIVLG